MSNSSSSVSDVAAETAEFERDARIIEGDMPTPDTGAQTSMIRTSVSIASSSSPAVPPIQTNPTMQRIAEISV